MKLEFMSRRECPGHFSDRANGATHKWTKAAPPDLQIVERQLAARTRSMLKTDARDNNLEMTLETELRMRCRAASVQVIFPTEQTARPAKE